MAAPLASITQPPSFAAGTNVFATIDGKEVGPIYLAQLAGDTATLQGIETYTVPVSALIRTA